MNVHVGSRQIISSRLDPGCLSAGERHTEVPSPPPIRGLCPCGHLMSMHCHADGSGPCATPECQCPGQGGGWYDDGR